MATKAVCVVDNAKAQDINLKVLRRIDPETEEVSVSETGVPEVGVAADVWLTSPTCGLQVVGAGGHVCLYDFIKGAPLSEAYVRPIRLG
jgi:hypothetical protein